MDIPARHPRKGDCIIIERMQTLGRTKVRVRYPDLFVTREEYLDELKDPRSGAEMRLSSPSVPSRPTSAVSESLPAWHSARQNLLALRLGQSTRNSVRELSVGMREVDTACQEALNRAKEGQLSFLLFVSPYGMGKTHALAHLRHLALERKSATGTVVLDGIGTTLSQPMGLISGLAHSIEFPDGPNSDGLSQRLAGLVRAESTQNLRVTGASFLYASLCKLTSEDAENADSWETVEDYLSLEISAGHASQALGVRLPPLRALRLNERGERAACLLREWAQACAIVGAKGGLTVLLDEADVDYAQCSRGQANINQRSELLAALRAIADRGPDGGYTRMVIAMAITPGAATPDPVFELGRALGAHLKTVHLKELEEQDIHQLGVRVCRNYRVAYALSDAESPAMEAIAIESLAALNRSVEQRNPRKFIRLLLEKLDAAYA